MVVAAGVDGDGVDGWEYLISSVALSIDEYYAGVGESPGVWAGRWAEGLGLSGVVEADQLRALVEGQDPVTGEDLVGGAGASVRAFDLTFSAPKSVSLLWALGRSRWPRWWRPPTGRRSSEAVGFLEERAAVARVQSGRRAPPGGHGGLGGGGVRASHGREGDPQLHTHCLIPNLVQRAGDGRVVAFDAGPLFEWAGRPGRSTRTICNGR